MKAVQIETLRDDDPLNKSVHVAPTVGKALDAHASDPRDGAVFRVTVIGDVRVAEE